MQVFDDRLPAESGWSSILTLLGNCHQNLHETSAEYTVENS